jgi:hypothetical protein
MDFLDLSFGKELNFVLTQKRTQLLYRKTRSTSANKRFCASWADVISLNICTTI